MTIIAQDALVVTPNDTTYLSKYGFIRNGASAGNIRILPVARANSNTPSDGVLISGVQAGEIIPIMVKKVFATNTTATVIEVLAP